MALDRVTSVLSPMLDERDANPLESSPAGGAVGLPSGAARGVRAGAAIQEQTLFTKRPTKGVDLEEGGGVVSGADGVITDSVAGVRREASSWLSDGAIGS